MDAVPKISVIIPIYNTEKYLQECLDSVLNQSLRDIEIICVNDGSTDNSLTMLQNYSKKDLRIIIITQDNLGQAAARNAGIKAACGEYVCFLDSDDLLVENALEELYYKAKQDKLEVLCYDIKCMYENEHLKVTNNMDSYYQRNISFGGVKTGKELFTEMIEKNSFIDSASNMLISRDWLIKNNIEFYPGILYEDSLFSFQCFMTANRMYHINKQYLIYRIRDNSTMTSGYTFHNLYSRLICYIMIIQKAYTLGLDFRTQTAVYKYASFVRENLKHIYNVLNNEERMKILTLAPLEKLYLEGLGIEQSSVPVFNEDIYLDGFKNLIHYNKKIIIYGAGHVGRQVLTYIRNINLVKHVMCFAVTDKENSEGCVMGLEVRCIDDLKYMAQDGYIIIAARKNHQEDMYKKARELGFNKIAVIDQMLEKAITANIEKNYRIMVD